MPPIGDRVRPENSLTSSSKSSKRAASSNHAAYFFYNNNEKKFTYITMISSKCCVESVARIGFCGRVSCSNVLSFFLVAFIRSILKNPHPQDVSDRSRRPPRHVHFPGADQLDHPTSRGKDYFIGSMFRSSSRVPLEARANVWYFQRDEPLVNKLLNAPVKENRPVYVRLGEHPEDEVSTKLLGRIVSAVDAIEAGTGSSKLPLEDATVVLVNVRKRNWLTGSREPSSRPVKRRRLDTSVGDEETPVSDEDDAMGGADAQGSDVDEEPAVEEPNEEEVDEELAEEESIEDEEIAPPHADALVDDDVTNHDQEGEEEVEVDEAAPTLRRSARIASLVRLSYKETRTYKTRRTRPFLARKVKKN